VYSTKGPELSGDDLVEEWFEPYGEMTRLNHEKLYWDTDAASPLDPNESPVVPYWGLNYNLTYFEIASVPANVQSFCGYANSNVVSCLTLGLSFAVGTLRYNGATVRRSWAFGTTPKFRVTYSFRYKPTGWNNFFNLDAGTGGAWMPIYNADGDQVYPAPLTAF